MKKLLVVVAMLLPAVGCQPVKTGETIRVEMEQTENNHARLVAATPPPSFEHSLEREMLVQRLKRLNVQNKLMYINVVSYTGQVVVSSPVMGKVSSLNSLLTTPEQVAYLKDRTGAGYIREKLPSPDFDGSYGKNPEGVFWFTPDDEYCETTMPYFLSDRPRKVNTPLSLQAAVNTEK